MSFDDRLRNELRQATESRPLDADEALRNVKSRHGLSTPAPAGASPDEPIAVALEAVDDTRRRRVRAQRLVGAAAAIAILAGGIAIPLALRDRGDDSSKHATPHRTNKVGIDRAALQAVASALDATSAAGSFHVNYTLTEIPSSAPTTTMCQKGIAVGAGFVSSGKNDTSVGIVVSDQPPTLVGPDKSVTIPTSMVCGSFGSPHNVKTTGSATVNVSPFAMLAISNVSGLGDVTVRVDDTNVWESLGSDTGPSSTLVTPSSLSIFAKLVNSTLGNREGAGAMMGLASPTGYLSITRAAITDASKIGTDTIDGVPVTVYRVSVDPGVLATVPGLSAEESTAIKAAVDQLHEEGFTGNTTDVSIDASGFVRRTKSVNNFADGGSTIGENTFSAFGCAGVVDIPGRPVTTGSGEQCADTSEPLGGTSIPGGTGAPSGPGPRGPNG